MLGFKPRHSSHEGKNPTASAENHHTALAGENHTALGLPLPRSLGSQKTRCNNDAELFLSSLEECRRDTAGRKGARRLLLVGHEKVLHSFGLTGN